MDGVHPRLAAAASAALALLVLAVAVPPASAVRSVRLPERVSTAALARPGLAIRLTAGPRDRFVRVRLRRVAGRRVVAARWLRVRAGRRQTVRWRLGAVTASRVPVGRYRLEARGGRHRGRVRGPGRRVAVRIFARAGGAAPPPAAGPSPSPSPSPSPAPAPAPGPTAPTGPPVVAAAGDISCPSFCAQVATAGLITDVIRPQAVLGLGDFQYDVGTLDLFRAFYDPTWGRFKSITYPINGDGEDSYGSGDWLTYWSSGAPVTPRAEASYSFDIGSWHIVALNSSCFRPESCDEAAWTSWLRRDLAASRARCTLAYWHLPYFTSPTAGEDGRPSLKAWYDVLYSRGVDVLLQAHQHFYERFAPQNPTGGRDTRRGITTFTVGTGGRSHAVPSGRAAHSVVLNADTFGVLALTLRPTGYDFRFVPVPGSTFRDAGTGTCH
jgi:hypothetical protein